MESSKLSTSNGNLLHINLYMAKDRGHTTCHPSIKRRAQLWRRGCRAQPAYLSTTVRASLNLAANTSPVKYSAKRPTACSRELKSRSEQCRRRQSFSAVMFSLCPGIQHLLVLQRRTNFSCNKQPFLKAKQGKLMLQAIKIFSCFPVQNSTSGDSLYLQLYPCCSRDPRQGQTAWYILN